MAGKAYNVLFLCTGNSARSILAEAILNRLGQGRFRAFSAGSQATGNVHPKAIQLLERLNYDTAGLRSKSWHEFTGADAPKLDFIFTVCDKAAGEPCPFWPGQPMQAHWGIEDPAMLYSSEKNMQKLFFATYCLLRRRIELFCNLPLHTLDAMSIRYRIEQIGLDLTPSTISIPHADTELALQS